MGSWDFENALTDDSAQGMNLTFAGATYLADQNIDPMVQAKITGYSHFWMKDSTIYGVRAGENVTLDGTASGSYEDTTTLTCVWSDQTGGSNETAILFTGSTSTCSTTAAFPTFGQYTLRLTVTDAGSDSSSRDFTIGAVATDSNGSVVAPDADLEFLLGDAIRGGGSRWPWLDYIDQRISDLSGEYPTFPTTADWNTAEDGHDIVDGSFSNDSYRIWNGFPKPVLRRWDCAGQPR